MRLSLDFSAETSQARRKQNDIFERKKPSVNNNMPSKDFHQIRKRNIGQGKTKEKEHVSVFQIFSANQVSQLLSRK